MSISKTNLESVIYSVVQFALPPGTKKNEFFIVSFVLTVSGLRGREIESVNEYFNFLIQSGSDSFNVCVHVGDRNPKEIKDWKFTFSDHYRQRHPHHFWTIHGVIKPMHEAAESLRNKKFWGDKNCEIEACFNCNYIPQIITIKNYKIVKDKRGKPIKFIVE